MESELKEIEAQDGFAYIIGHIPPYDFLHQFGARYQSLMERYQHIIRFSSFGHTHRETLHVNNAVNTTTPIGFWNIAGSGTSVGGNNPAFTVIDFDAEYMVPVNTHTYIMNLTEANAGNEPKWYVIHDLIKEYSLPDLRPTNIKNFLNKLNNDPELAAEYDWNRHQRGQPKPTVRSNEKFECEATSETFERKACLGEPTSIMSLNNLKGYSQDDIFNYAIANWIEIKK